MKPGLRKVAALILATATMFGGGALSASTALADDLTVDSSTQVQADTSNSGNADTNSGDTQSDTTSSSNADSQTQSDVHSDTSIRAQSAPEDAKDVTIHDMLDTDSAYVSKLKLTDRVTGTAPFDNDNERGDEQEAKDIEDMAEHYMRVCESCNKYLEHDPVSVFEGWLLGEELGSPYETRRHAALHMLSAVRRLDRD